MERQFHGSERMCIRVYKSWTTLHLHILAPARTHERSTNEKAHTHERSTNEKARTHVREVPMKNHTHTHTPTRETESPDLCAHRTAF